MEEVARIVLALEQPEVAEEVLHFLDRSGVARVVGTASDPRQLAEAIRQLEPDGVVSAPSLAPSRGQLNGSALLALDTTQSVASLRRAIRSGASGFSLAGRARCARRGRREDPAAGGARGRRPGAGARGLRTTRRGRRDVRRHAPRGRVRAAGKRCVLVDLDVVFADATAAVGAPTDESLRTIGDLLPLGDEISPRHVEDVLWRHAEGFDVLFAPSHESAAVNVRGHHYRAAVEAARRACDVVVLHVPRGLDEIARTGLEIADRVVLVLGPRRPFVPRREAAHRGRRARGPMRVRGQSGSPVRDRARRRRARLRRVADRRHPDGPRRGRRPGPRAAAPAAWPHRPLDRPAGAAAAGGRVSAIDGLRDVRQGLHERLLRRMDARELEGVSRAERRLRVREEALAVLREQGHILPQGALSKLVNEVSDAVVGMGPIEFLLKDPDVTEVMVNGPDDVYVERKGRIEKVGDRLFEGEEAVFHVIERIVAPLGLRVDGSSPWVDARLSDGSRVHAIVPPLSLCGPVLTVRKFSAVPLGPARSHRERDDRAADARLPRRVRPRPSQHRRVRRHELGQDDDARRPLGVHPGRRTDRHDRGRGRAPPRASPT